MFKFSEDKSLSDYTFVIPSLSVGNVPQLAVDLVIETLQMKKIAFAWSSGIVPIIGPPAFDGETQCTTSCELFINEAKKLAAIQLRAPVAAKSLDSFLSELINYLSKSASRVIVLASCYSHERHDSALQRTLEYLGNEQFCETYSKQLVGYVKHESTDNPLPGQGFATRFYKALQDQPLNIPIGVLFAYVSEGDNVPEAKELALFLNQVTGIFDAVADRSVIRVPMSWKLLFGNAGPVEMF